MCLAMPAKITSINVTDESDAENSAQTHTARIDYGGLTKSVDLSFVPEAEIGQYVLVHAGFAISVLDEAEAQASISAFSQWQDEKEV